MYSTVLVIYQYCCGGCLTRFKVSATTDTFWNIRRKSAHIHPAVLYHSILLLLTAALWVHRYYAIPTGDGVTRQVLADHQDLMLVLFSFNVEGAEGALHNHPHVQSTYVKSGRFKFTIDDVVTEVAAGDSFVIPSNAIHGCVCLEPGQLVDCFTPRRDDFLEN